MLMQRRTLCPTGSPAAMCLLRKRSLLCNHTAPLNMEIGTSRPICFKRCALLHPSHPLKGITAGSQFPIDSMAPRDGTKRLARPARVCLTLHPSVMLDDQWCWALRPAKFVIFSASTHTTATKRLPIGRSLRILLYGAGTITDDHSWRSDFGHGWLVWP